MWPSAWDHMEAHVTDALKGASGRKSELVLQWQNGTRSEARHYDVCYTPVPGDSGAMSGVLVDVYDATASRTTERSLKARNSRLHQLFTETPVFIALAVGPELRLEFVNRASEKLFGGRSPHNQSLREAIPEAAEQDLLKLLTRVYDAGKPYVASDLRFCVRDSTTGKEEIQYLDLVCQPVRDEADQVYGVLFTAYDVTRRTLAQVETDRLRHRRLHDSRVDAMGTMAMTLAHELNQPLAAVSNYISGARRLMTRNRGESQDLLQLAQDEIRRAGDVVRRARSLVRVGSADRASVSIRETCDRAFSLLEASGSHSLKMRLELAPDATHVLADEVQLEQVFVNLLRNASEASRNSGRKEVIISSERRRNGRIVIRIRDFGCGFPAELLETLFSRVGASSGEGLGVGLPLTRTILEANRGKIDTTNADGGGAVVVIELDTPSATEYKSLV